MATITVREILEEGLHLNAEYVFFPPLSLKSEGAGYLPHAWNTCVIDSGTQIRAMCDAGFVTKFPVTPDTVLVYYVNPIIFNSLARNLEERMEKKILDKVKETEAMVEQMLRNKGFDSHQIRKVFNEPEGD